MSCPPDEVLACYIEDSLFLEARRRVEEHAADCDRCATVLAETVCFRGGDVADPPASRVASVLRAAWYHVMASFAQLGWR